ncbi:ATP-binding cassette sub- A member 1 [Gaertneriomyces sp. JEL0708]|nr:ATP-binding cassette sub- A member 1 [Gaertneriomyces sp. JEL0708]
MAVSVPQLGARSASALSEGYNPDEEVLEEKGFFRSCWDQLWIMLKRNAILQIRYTKSTLSQTVIAPLLFMLLLFILQKADHSNQNKTVLDPPSAPLFGVPDCLPGESGPCINFMYVAASPTDAGRTEQIIRAFADKNAKRTGVTWPMEQPMTSLQTKVERKMGMVPVPDQDFIYAHTLVHPNVTNWAVTFTITDTPILNVAYQVWYNASRIGNGTDVFGRELVSVMRGLDEAIIGVLNGATVSANVDVTLKDWPTIPPRQVSDSIVQNLGPVFFFCSEMVIFINVLNQVVSEKEAKLRHSMQMMGLRTGIYWLSWFISTMWLVAINSLVTGIWGLIFGFSAFRNTNFGVVIVTFFLFGLGMLSLAFLITTFVRRARTAILIGIFIFIIGLLFESFVFSSAYVGYIWWDQGTAPAAYKVLMFLPFFNFGKIFLDFTTLTTGRLDSLTSTFIPGPGFPWSQLYEKIPSDLTPIYSNGNVPDIPVPVESWYLLLMNIALYGVLTLYFDAVIPDEFGMCYPFYFFLVPKYWGIGGSQTTGEKEWIAAERAKGVVDSGEVKNPDVQSEKEKAFDDRASPAPAIRILNLRKVYQNGWFKSKKDKVAVKGLNFAFETGKLYSLLGQNGAGKSTSMNILSGLTPASDGDARMFGLSIKTGLPRIRRFLGVCPQHDLLFGDLTAEEHIRLYAGLKGVRADKVDELVEDRLTAVRLHRVRKHLTSTYSGGMKRRLSLIISTLGNPRIVFLDEPTTGMDPVNRRHVWHFIEKFKRGRVIVLTTHSMEEADVLGDSVIVMAHGRVRATGTSVGLKARYGGGYRVSIITPPAETDATKNHIATTYPRAVLEDDAAGALLYTFPKDAEQDVPRLVRELELRGGAWGIGLTTLEEVFLRVVREANPGGYSGYERAAGQTDMDGRIDGQEMESVRKRTLQRSLSRARAQQDE